jgi:hypothetical protein
VFELGAAAVGTIVAPLVAAQTVSDAAADDVKMASIITLYNGVGYGVLGLVVLFMGIFFGTSIVLEIEEEDSPTVDENATRVVPKSRLLCFFSHPIWSYRRLGCAWFANFINLFNQVIIAQFFIEYSKTVRPGKPAEYRHKPSSRWPIPS